MSPEGTDATESDEDPSLGEPIIELRDVGVTLDHQFSTRVRGRIERRVLVGEAVELICAAPVTMLLEFMRWPLDVFHRRRP